MKTSKKIIIPFFSTVVGLSLAAGIGGAFAWYQYNSQATASFLGSSVADTGVLQIGWKTIDNKGTADTSDDVEVMHWGRDFVQGGEAAKLTPVTFGEMGADNALPAKAYAYPESGIGTGYDKWVEAEAGKQYAQFDFYLRALKPNPDSPANTALQIPQGYELVERDVFISDFACKSVTNDKVADEALRIHLAVENQENRLLSKVAHDYDPSADPIVDNRLNLYGPLDLDQSGENDKAITTAFKSLADYGTYDDDDDDSTPDVPVYTEGQTIIYGVDGQKQATEALEDLKQERDTEGKMPTSSDPEYSKKILTTSTSDLTKITLTVWLEGWEYLKTAGTEKSQTWNPKYAAGTQVQVGLQFDSGIFRGEDL